MKWREDAFVACGDVDKLTSDASTALRELEEVSGSLREFEVPAGLAEAFGYGYGWWRRVLRTAQGIVLLHSAELQEEASPLLRTLLHHAAAIEWLRRHQTEAVEALREEDDQRRHDLVKHASRRQWDLAEVNLGSRPTRQKLVGLRALREPEVMCDLAGASNLYVAYRLESALAHPSAMSARAYWQEIDEGAPQMRDVPERTSPPLSTAAMFAGAATRSLGEMIGDSRLTQAADAIGERLGMATSFE